MSMPRFKLPAKEHTKEQHAMAYHECWSCGQPANNHCGPGDPRPGDVIVCLSCADPALFVVDGSPRQPSPEEHAGIIADPEYRSFKAVIQAANRRAFQSKTE